MDLVATLRVLGKHKFLVVMVLAITIGGTAGAWINSSQTKEASGSYVLLSAPAPQPNPDGSVTVVSNNPFSDMDQSTVVDVLVRAVSTEQVASELQQAGLVGTYEVAGNLDFIRGPLFDVTATAPTDEEALAGFDLVSLAVGRTLEQRQLEAGANPDYLITMQQVSNPVVSTPGLVGRIRTSIVLLAVGVVVAVASALGLDLLQQRRRRRKALRASGRPEASTASEAEEGVTAPSGSSSVVETASPQPAGPGEGAVAASSQGVSSSEPVAADGEGDDEEAAEVAEAGASTDQEAPAPATSDGGSDDLEGAPAEAIEEGTPVSEGSVADDSAPDDDRQAEDLDAQGQDPDALDDLEDDDLEDDDHEDDGHEDDDGRRRTGHERVERRSPYVVATGLKAAGLKAAGLRASASSGVERGAGN